MLLYLLYIQFFLTAIFRSLYSQLVNYFRQPSQENDAGKVQSSFGPAFKFQFIRDSGVTFPNPVKIEQSNSGQ